jgi:epoxyqueuosine reductase QueG
MQAIADKQGVKRYLVNVTVNDDAYSLVVKGNTLLVNDKLGNMLWMSAVLIDVALTPDPPADYVACLPGCTACIKACPAGALGSERMEQMRCYEYAYTVSEGEETIHCWRCRNVCPNRDGVKHAPLTADAQGRTRE